MQFEEFDKKIREAAEKHHPAYDEKAWGRMEKLLNKHLPQENDGRRRIIFLLFLFLALGGGSAWLFISKPWGGKKQSSAANTIIQKTTGDIQATVPSDAENRNGDINKRDKEEIAGLNVSGYEKTRSNPSAPDQTASILKPVNKKDRDFNITSATGFPGKKQKMDLPFQSFKMDQEPIDKNLIKGRLNEGQFDATTTKTNAPTLIPGQNNKNIATTPVQNLVTTTPAKPGPDANDSSGKAKPNKDNTSLVQNSPQKKEKVKIKKGNTFFFTLSAGPDVSATGSDKVGKTRLSAGGGLGFTFKDRLTIRSGFYTGRKVYTSSPGSYHPPANFWNYYPNLEKVDADCRVYEIPLSLSYNIGRSTKHNGFISAGISSYLMKKETYNYFYKYTAGGPTIQRKWTIQDENKHYFSVLTLSGGYQKNIGKSFSVMVEPYFKIPLAGVGFGKVKLNSAGLLFSVGIKPFAGSGKHNIIHR